MRASPTEATGTAGQSAVKAQFEELGWGAVPNPEHDLGTDLWLSPRDSRRWDLGVMGGAQVKNGRSFFSGHEKRDADGEITGWWYYEADSRHFDYWLGHACPHLLILRDPDTSTSYWVAVLPDAVVSTGSGRKILVPRTQVVSDAHREALTKVVARRSGSSWEGSAWSLAQPVAATDLLRYAMLTPRLIAPHPNTDPDQLTAAQAIGTCTSMRLQDLEQLRGPEARVESGAAAGAESWDWQFFDTWLRWVQSANREAFEALPTPDQPHQIAAAAVAQALAAMEDGDAARSLAITEQALSAVEYGPVDHAWLMVHEAWARVELGAYEVALELVVAVQEVRVTHPHDPTASAIAASATALAFGAASWQNRDVAGLVQSSDTSARWWRSQSIAWGLGKHFEDQFRAWADDASSYIVSSDQAFDHLRSASLVAGLSADSDAWRYAASLLARRILMQSPDDAVRAEAGLLTLLRTGPEKESSLTARRLMLEGPVAAVVAAGRALQLPSAPRSAIFTQLRFLKQVGDVLEPEIADRHAAFIVNSLANPEQFLQRFRPTFLVEPALVEALAGLCLAASDTGTGQIHEFLARIPQQPDQHTARCYAGLIRRLSQKQLPDKLLGNLRTRSGDHTDLLNEVARVTPEASRDEAGQAALLDRAAAGDVAALFVIGDITSLTDAAAGALLDVLERQLDAQIDQVRSGTTAWGGYDIGSLIVQLSAWHPAVARWDALLRLLEEAAEPAGHLHGAVDMLVSFRRQLSEAVRQQIRPALEALKLRAPEEAPLAPIGASDISVAATEALASLFHTELGQEMTQRLFTMGSDGRCAAARVIARSDDAAKVDVLAVLLEDEERAVRVAAAGGLAGWVCRGVATEAAHRMVVTALEDTGVAVALGVSQALSNGTQSGLGEILHVLGQSPHAVVRLRAKAPEGPSRRGLLGG